MSEVKRDPPLKCKHCNNGVWHAAGRGLCRTCHNKPEVRALYKVGKYAKVKQEPDYKPDRWPVPTDAAPGTLAKVLVLAFRRENNQYLHHPYDSKGFVDTINTLERMLPDATV